MSWLINSMTPESFYIPLHKTFGKKLVTLTPPWKICLNYLLLKAYFRTFDRENPRSHHTSPHLHDIGNNWTYSRFTNGNSQTATVFIRRLLKKKRIFKFLSGLNNSLDEVPGRILGTKPLPSLRTVFSEVRHEKSRRKVMLSPQSATFSTDGSCLTAHTSSNTDPGLLNNS